MASSINPLIPTTTPPSPLPSTVLRLVANSIVTEARRAPRNGWREHKASRAWHPTGNPRASGGGGGGAIPRSELLDNSETIEYEHFLRGTVDPNAGLRTPPILWELQRTSAETALEGRADLTRAYTDLTRRDRRDLPFRPARNRHGTLTMRPNEPLTGDQRTAIQLVAAVATILYVVDEADYWDAIRVDFDASAVFAALEAA